jgi:hypothetical protein
VVDRLAALRFQGGQRVDVVGRADAQRRNADEFAGVAADLVR